MEYAAVLVVLVLILGALMIRAIIKHNRVLGRRPQELREAGAALGLSLSELDPDDDGSEDRRLLQGTTLAADVEEMEAGLGEMLVGELEGFEVRVGEYFRSRAGGRAPSDYHTVLLLAPRQGRLPRFYLQTTRDRTKLKKISGAKEIERYVAVDLDPHPPLGDALELAAHPDDAKAAQDVLLGAEVVEHLKARPSFVESTGERLLIHAPGLMVAGSELAAHVRKGLWLAGLLLRRSPYRG